VLDLKNWLNPKHYNRLWNVGPPGLIFSVFLICLTHAIELFFNMKTYELSAPWFYVLFVLVLAEAVFILVWVLLILPPKKRGKTLCKKGIYSFIRHPIYTTIIFHLNILFSLWWGSFLLFFLIPIQYLFWSKIIIKEEQYLVGIFGEEYIDYMSNVSRFIPWK
tara:strand:- start:2796 stop:3284 length:489 start_codon:yes stop_codon:yes gene_type:complete